MALHDPRHNPFHEEYLMPRHELELLLANAKAQVARMTPEEKEAMLRKQAESWARSEAQWAKDFAEGKCERD